MNFIRLSHLAPALLLTAAAFTAVAQTSANKLAATENLRPACEPGMFS
jgi:hypothetical protein